MAIKSLPKYRDLRGKLRTKGSYTKYPLSKKTVHVVHHSLTEEGSAEAYANYHVGTHGWPGIAYHFVIDKDGTINQTNDLEVSSYHVGNSNSFSIGTVLTGDFRKGKQKPTQEQMESLYLLNKELFKEVPSLKETKGHQEMAGYSWKNCPGDNWNYKKVIDGSLVSSDDVKSPASLPYKYVIQEGDTFWSIAKELEGVSVEELKTMNPKVDPTKLTIGMSINLAKTPLGQTYKVKAGDTFWGIARAYNGIDMEDLIKANPKVNPKALQIGQEIFIPSIIDEKPPAKPKPSPKPATPSYVGKRVEAKVDLRFYSKPSWDDKDVAGECKKGWGFTIIDKLTVNGFPQYKVKNSNGKVFYITASTKYVRVE